MAQASRDNDDDDAPEEDDKPRIISVSGAVFLGGGRNNTPKEELDAFGGEIGEPKVREIGVLKPNLESVQVFRLCEQTIVGGMGTSWHGISAQEIVAAMIARRVKRKHYDEVSENVRYMGSVVAEAINEKVSKAIKRKQQK